MSDTNEVKVDGTPLLVDAGAAKVARGRGRPRKYPYPATLTCTVTGKVVKTNPTQFESLMKRTGKTMEEVIATYVSREGRRQEADRANDGKNDPDTDAPQGTDPAAV